jgi:tripartite-type tricarboxylate transporter receptor subunit TctC
MTRALQRGVTMRARLALPALLLPLPFTARAQPSGFPNRPVRWIIPTSTGAGTDATGRYFAKLAGDAWKQPVVVDNRSGASGMIGLDALAAAAPDGYTQGFMSVSQFLDATLLGKFAFDAKKDLTPISMLALAPLILLANAGTGITSLAQLIERAKANPGSLNYASGGAGGITHFAMEIFLRKAGIRATHVPYKGSGPAVMDTLSGQVQLVFSTPPAALPHVKSGRLRALAIASRARSPLAPDVPTFEESGLSGLELSTWYALFGPANLPPDLLDHIASTVLQAARPPAVREKLASEGIEPILSTPADFQRGLRAEREQWLNVAKEIGFKRES